MRKRAHLPSGS